MKLIPWLVAPVLLLAYLACSDPPIYTCPDPSMPCDPPDAGADGEGGTDAG